MARFSLPTMAVEDYPALPALPEETGVISSQLFAEAIGQVAVAALVVNGPEWQVKANVMAREMLRAYFAAQGSEGVTRPSLAAVAIRPAHHPAR